MSDSDFTRTLKAWHGSPHDFEEFRNEAIGTGEGTAWRGGYGVRGHGHYVAEERKVAESYRDRLSKKNQTPVSYTFNGWENTAGFSELLRELYNVKDWARRIEKAKKLIGPNTDEDTKERVKDDENELKAEIAHLHLKSNNFGAPELMDLDLKEIQHLIHVDNDLSEDHPQISKNPTVSLQRAIFDEKNKASSRMRNGWNTADETRAEHDAADKALDRLLPIVKKMTPVSQEPQGRLYELNLNLEPHELLDWDEPLQDYHEHAMGKIMDIPEIEDAMAADSPDEAFKDRDLSPESSGQEIYEFLTGEHGTAIKASNRLLEHGIKGIRYKDQGSRNRSPILELDGNVIDHSTKYWPTHEEIQNDSEARDHRYAMIIAHQADHGRISLDEAAVHMKSSYEQDPQFFGEFPAVLEWYEKNKHRIKFEPPPPTYNYVIFDPTAIKIMRKLGMKGEVVKDFTDTGVHVKPVSHDPFKE